MASLELISGLDLHLNVIDAKLQADVMKKIDLWLSAGRRNDRSVAEVKGSTYTPIPSNFSYRKQSREMLQFGVYTHSNRVDLHAKVAPMPNILLRVIEILTEKGLIENCPSNEWCCTVNSYEEGQWIPPHIDNQKFKRPFVTLSLLSEELIVFSPHVNILQNDMSDEVNNQNDDEIQNVCEQNKNLHSVDDSEVVLSKIIGDNGVSYPLPVGSLLVIGGEAANSFTHAVPPVSSRRVSLTFRRLMPEVEEQHAQILKDALLEDMAKRDAKKQARAKVREEKNMKKIASKEKKKKELEQTGNKSGGGAFGEGKSMPVPQGLLKHIQSNNNQYCIDTGVPSQSTTSLTNLDQNLDQMEREMKHRSHIVKMPLLEKEHVQRLYDAIASNWHGTRYKSWPKVEAFIERCPPYALICDAGCGNGKNLPACCYDQNIGNPNPISSAMNQPAHEQGIHGDGGDGGGGDGDGDSNSVRGSESLRQRSSRGYGIGSDFSKELVAICAERGLEALVADSLALPFRTNGFDACLSIAVLHHISTTQRRKMLIAEALRVVKVGGRALFYAWAQDQTGGHSKHEFAAPDVLVPFHMRVDQSAPVSQLKNAELSHSLEHHSQNKTMEVINDNEDENENRLKRQKATKESLSPIDEILMSDEGEVIKHGAVDNEKSSIVYQRYCHVYAPGELTQLALSLNDSGVNINDNMALYNIQRKKENDYIWVEVEEEYYDTGNWCLIARKVKEMPQKLFI